MISYTEMDELWGQVNEKPGTPTMKSFQAREYQSIPIYSAPSKTRRVFTDTSQSMRGHKRGVGFRIYFSMPIAKLARKA